MCMRGANIIFYQKYVFLQLMINHLQNEINIHQDVTFRYPRSVENQNADAHYAENQSITLINFHNSGNQSATSMEDYCSGNRVATLMENLHPRYQGETFIMGSINPGPNRDATATENQDSESLENLDATLYQPENEAWIENQDEDHQTVVNKDFTLVGSVENHPRLVESVDNQEHRLARNQNYDLEVRWSDTYESQNPGGKDRHEHSV